MLLKQACVTSQTELFECRLKLLAVDQIAASADLDDAAMLTLGILLARLSNLHGEVYVRSCM